MESRAARKFPAISPAARSARSSIRRIESATKAHCHPEQAERRRICFWFSARSGSAPEQRARLELRWDLVRACARQILRVAQDDKGDKRPPPLSGVPAAGPDGSHG